MRTCEESCPAGNKPRFLSGLTGWVSNWVSTIQLDVFYNPRHLLVVTWNLEDLHLFFGVNIRLQK